VVHQGSRNDYSDIAKDMLASGCTVIMGAGNPGFTNDGEPNAKPDYRYVGGEDTWQALLAGKLGTPPWRLVQSRADIQALGDGPTPPRVLAVPQVAATLQEGRRPASDRNGDGKVDSQDARTTAVGDDRFNDHVPTLAELSRAALNVLDDDPDGLFLMIEGGAVDWAAHDNLPGRLIEEQRDFNRAVEAVVAWVTAHGGWDQTLLIVTGDHETGFLTGPDGDPSKPLTGHGAGRMPDLKFNSGSHTNSLIPLYANGRGCERFQAEQAGEDPVRGPYVDNTAMAKVVFELWR
jgi:alkaline phosphatase